MTMFVYLIFYTICVLNLVMGVKKKKCNALYAFALIVVFVLMTFNFEGPDIRVYRLTYEIVGDTTAQVSRVTYMERSYTMLMVLGNKIGLDFFAFRIILSFACLWLFCSTVKHYKANGNMVIGLYMFYLFFFDTIQLRNCIAQFIILFATRYLFKRSGWSTLKYLLCVVIASSFHTIAWVALSFLLVKVSRKKPFFRNIFIFAGILFALCIVTKPLLPRIINFISKYIEHGASYLQGNIHYGYWIVLGLHLFGIVPLYIYRSGVKNKDVQVTITNIMHVNIILCLFLPLTLFNNNFNRIFRNNMILTQIGLALMYQHSEKRSRSGQAAMASLTLMTAGWLVSDMLRYRIFNIISPVLEKNLIFALVGSANINQYLVVTVLCLLVVLIAYIFKKHSNNNFSKI